MTEADKDAVIGRVLRERREAEQHLGHLCAEASRLAQTLATLGGLLKTNPEHVVFERQGINAKYSTGGIHPLFKAEEIDGSKIKTLVDKIRETMDKIDSLAEQARRLGF